MDAYSTVISQIIKEQQTIIGPVALDQAKKVSGLEVTTADNVKISGDAKTVLGNLVSQYSKLFGRASIEVCRDAVRESKVTLSSEQLPDVLR